MADFAAASSPIPESGAPVLPKLAVSACLLGRKVRYDGRSAPLDELRNGWREWAQLEPICPEVAAGFAVPREPIRFHDGRLIGRWSGFDATPALEKACSTLLEQWHENPPDGVVLQSRSPSCGTRGVKCEDRDGKALPDGQGIFVQRLAAELPHVPILDAADLRDAFRREWFLDRVLAGFRLRQMLEREELTVADLLEFHETHYLLLMTHAPGRTAELKKLALRGAAESYTEKFVQIVAAPPLPANHGCVLRWLRDQLGPEIADCREALDSGITAAAAGKWEWKALQGMVYGWLLRTGRADLLNQSYWERLAPPYLVPPGIL